MAFFSRRRVRRRLLAGGVPRRLVPQSRLAQLTAYLAAIAILFYLLRLASLAAGRPGLIALTAWWSNATAWAAALCGAGLLFRWMRQRMLWRLRNRLIVTYVFIGVIPVVLIVLIALLAGYLIGGQYATSLPSADLEAELRRLQAANASVAAQLAALPAPRAGRATAAAPSAITELAHVTEAFSRGEVVAWRGKGKQAVFSSVAEPSFARPQWLTGDFRAVTAAPDGKLYLRVAKLVGSGSDGLLVASSAPVDKELLDRVAQNIGVVRLGRSALRIRLDEASTPSPGQARISDRSVNGQLSPRAERWRARRAGAAGLDPSLTATLAQGGSLPRARGAWDVEHDFISLFNIRDWESGEDAPMLLRVSTRPSALYDRLFGNVGFFGGAILGALVAVAAFFALIEFAALIIGTRLTRTITGSIAELYQATQHINRGDFSHRIQVRSNDQLAELEQSFNAMTENLERLIVEQKEKERLQNELAIAQEVQEQLFPRDPAQLPSLEVHGVCRPARIVSGDYYDFIPFGGDKLGISVGDISGKGISAALMMATVHSAVRAYEQLGHAPLSAALSQVAGAGAPSSETAALSARSARNGAPSPSAAMTLLNRHLYQSTPAEKYATLFLAVYDDAKRSLTYSNAGHLPPLILCADGSVRRLEDGGLVIGLFDNLHYEERSVELRRGDLFVAFSDGIIEPENDFGEFGEERLLEIVRENRHLPLARVSDAVTQAVQDWIGAAEQPDDVTLVLARAR